MYCTQDPTVIKLQNLAAAKFGKEAALFVPSGTMSNLIGVACHCEQRDAEVLLGEFSHIHLYEQGVGSRAVGLYLGVGLVVRLLVCPVYRTVRYPHYPFKEICLRTYLPSEHRNDRACTPKVSRRILFHANDAVQRLFN
jgi:hypothetical protein